MENPAPELASPAQLNIPNAGVPRVVIIGGGFGGLELAKRLRNKPVQIVLLDRNNYHLFQPLLYQVATGGLEPGSIAYPLRRIFKRHRNLFFRVTEVLSIDTEAKCVQTGLGSLPYDYLVASVGTTNNFFGNANLPKLAVTLKSIPQALDMRSLLLQNFEEALLADDPDAKAGLMNIVIAGAGPTGVEMAGALSELKNHVLPADYPELAIDQAQIHLVDGGPRPLGGMSEASSEAARAALQKMGVQMHFNSIVKDFDGETVTYAAESEPGTLQSIRTRTLVWTAGVTGVALPGTPKEATVRGNRLRVNAQLQVVMEAPATSPGTAMPGAAPTPGASVPGQNVPLAPGMPAPMGAPAASPVAQATGGTAVTSADLDVVQRVVPGLYAIGDIAWTDTDPDWPKGHPQVAQVAIQMGKLAAANILAHAAGQPLGKFKYKDLGAMATIGRNRAVVDLNKLRFKGFIAWVMWLVVHLMALVGFRNKAEVLLNWLWNYITYDRSLRLIIRPYRREKAVADAKAGVA